METESAISSQTDESKAEQIHQDSLRNNPPAPCLADTVLQHHPSIIRLCQALAACKASSLSMLANMSQQVTYILIVSILRRHKNFSFVEHNC